MIVRHVHENDTKSSKITEIGIVHENIHNQIINKNQEPISKLH